MSRQEQGSRRGGADQFTSRSSANNTTENNEASIASIMPIIQQQHQQEREQRSSEIYNSSTVIVNPYKKQTHIISTSSTDNDKQDPIVHKRRQFIDKYRLQSLKYCNNTISHRKRRGSKSALEVLRSNQLWRQLWRRNCEDHQQPSRTQLKLSSRTINNNQFAMRPRLFLFQRLIMMQQQQQPQKVEINSVISSHHQQQQSQGVWELGNGITEVSGEGGSGKTQICLSLCMTCALTPIMLFPNNDNESSSLFLSNNVNYKNDDNSHDSYYTSIYITMGGGTSQSKIAKRLHQMLRDRCSYGNNVNGNDNINNNNSSNHDDEATLQEHTILSRIWLLSIKNEDDFIEFVEVHLPNILDNQSCGIKPQYHHHHHHQQQQQHTPKPQLKNYQYPFCSKVGFIAFDGIAGFFRFTDPLFQEHHQQSSSCYKNPNKSSSIFHQNRSSKLFQVSSLLRRISDVYDVPIVITNQVTTSIPSDDGLTRGGQQPTSLSMTTMVGGRMHNKIQPALGLIWSNCVCTRFILQRKDGFFAKISHESSSKLDDASNDENKTTTPKTITKQSVRKACVLQSVCTPEQSEVWFVIHAGAVVAMP